MAKEDQQNQELKNQEKDLSASEQRKHFEIENAPVPERKEALPEDKIVSEELIREIEMMDLDENLKKMAEQKAQKIQFLADDKKIEHLLQLAREKGVLFAIKAAKSMNDPFLLDTLHDTLAREGLYQKFIK